MAISPLAKHLEAQILDEGRVSWNEQADSAFEAILDALEELQSAGLFKELRPHTGNYRGGPRVDKVSISLVNPDYVRKEDPE